MNLNIKDLPLNTPLRKKRGPNKEQIRSRVKIKITEFDEDKFAVGLRRGVSYVKKFVVDRNQGGKALSQTAVEKEVRSMIEKGTFDKEIFEDYDKLKPGPKKKRGRGRPPKSASARKGTGKRGRPRKNPA
jgi:hypothetical protein